MGAVAVNDPQKALPADLDLVEKLTRKVEWYSKRANILQHWQSLMRDPERKIVCDILANGFTLTTKEEITRAGRVMEVIEAQDRVIKNLFAVISSCERQNTDEWWTWFCGRMGEIEHEYEQIAKIRNPESQNPEVKN
jgi:hypothetical protein